jgi:hypothetical protein
MEQTLLQWKPYQSSVAHTEPGYLQKRMEEYRMLVQQSASKQADEAIERMGRE